MVGEAVDAELRALLLVDAVPPGNAPAAGESRPSYAYAVHIAALGGVQRAVAPHRDIASRHRGGELVGALEYDVAAHHLVELPLGGLASLTVDGGGDGMGVAPTVVHVRANLPGRHLVNRVETRKLLSRGADLRFDRLSTADLALAMSHVSSKPRSAPGFSTPARAFRTTLGDDAAALLDVYGVEDVPIDGLDLTPGLTGRTQRGAMPR